MPRQVYDSQDGWYGLMVNGELRAVQRFRDPPLIRDFSLGYCDSSFVYQVVQVDISVLGYVPCQE